LARRGGWATGDSEIADGVGRQGGEPPALRTPIHIEPSSDKAALYELAYEEAGRALSEQQQVVESFRTRAGLLLSTAAISTSFLGARALDAGSGAPVWLAMATFAGLTIASLIILWPRRWEFAANSRDVMETYTEVDDAVAIAEVHRDLALHMHESFQMNQEGSEKLALVFEIASVLLTVEIVLWIFAIATPG
jgi:hypothetical protein